MGASRVARMISVAAKLTTREPIYMFENELTRLLPGHHEPGAPLERRAGRRAPDRSSDTVTWYWTAGARSEALETKGQFMLIRANQQRKQRELSRWKVCILENERRSTRVNTQFFLGMGVGPLRISYLYQETLGGSKETADGRSEALEETKDQHKHSDPCIFCYLAFVVSRTTMTTGAVVGR